MAAHLAGGVSFIDARVWRGAPASTKDALPAAGAPELVLVKVPADFDDFASLPMRSLVPEPAAAVVVVAQCDGAMRSFGVPPASFRLVDAAEPEPAPAITRVAKRPLAPPNRRAAAEAAEAAEAADARARADAKRAKKHKKK